MNASPKNEPERILVVGRSPSVLVATVDILRAKGYSADATNQFDQVLDDYDVTDLDVLVFGGMVPADTKQQLREDISERNPHVTFVQGLAGIAGLIAAQVQAATSTETLDGGEVSLRRGTALGATHPQRFRPGHRRGMVGHILRTPRAQERIDARVRWPTRRGLPHHPHSRSRAVRSILRRCHRRARSPACSPSARCPLPSRGWHRPPRTDNRLPQVSRVTTSSDDR